MTSCGTNFTNFPDKAKKHLLEALYQTQRLWSDCLTGWGHGRIANLDSENKLVKKIK